MNITCAILAYVKLKSRGKIANQVVLFAAVVYIIYSRILHLD